MTMPGDGRGRRELPDPLLGSVLGGARLDERIAQTRFSNVYRGRLEGSGIPVAVKVLNPRVTASSSGLFGERFLREGRALSALDHEAIVRVYDVGQERGLCYITMAFIEEALPLRDASFDDISRPERALELVGALAAALDHIHTRGLIHRDLKPSNVVLRFDGKPVLIDFGLVKAEDDEGIQLTAPGTIVGTANYMPPEQADPHGALGKVGPVSDIYGLGSVLYFILTGRPPFLGKNPIEVCRRVVTDEPARPRAVNPAVPPGLEALCLRAMAKEQADRFQSAREMLDEIDRLRRDGMGIPTPLAPEEATPEQPGRGGRAPSDASRAAAPASARPAWLIGSAIAGWAIAAAELVYILLQRS